MRRFLFRSFSSLVKEPPGPPINYYLNTHKNNILPPPLPSYFLKNIVKSLESSFQENALVMAFYRIWEEEGDEKERDEARRNLELLLEKHHQKITKLSTVFTILYKSDQTKKNLSTPVFKKLVDHSLTFLNLSQYNFQDLGVLLIDYYIFLRQQNYDNSTLEHIEAYIKVNRLRLSFVANLNLSAFFISLPFSNLFSSDIQVLSMLLSNFKDDILLTDFRIISLYMSLTQFIIYLDENNKIDWETKAKCYVKEGLGILYKNVEKKNIIKNYRNQKKEMKEVYEGLVKLNLMEEAEGLGVYMNKWE